MCLTRVAGVAASRDHCGCTSLQALRWQRARLLAVRARHRREGRFIDPSRDLTLPAVVRRTVGALNFPCLLLHSLTFAPPVLWQHPPGMVNVCVCVRARSHYSLFSLCGLQKGPRSRQVYCVCCINSTVQREGWCVSICRQRPRPLLLSGCFNDVSGLCLGEFKETQTNTD